MQRSCIHPRKWHGFVILLSLVTPVAAVTAQAGRDTTRRDSTIQRMEQVIVTGARSPALVGGAAAVVVAPSELNVTPAPSLQEVLRQVPFVLVRQNSRGEMEISVRGSESRQVAMMLDGLPLTIGWDHRADPSLIPASGVQSVKLIRGLSSLLDGPNTLGGVIDIGLGRSDLGPSPRSELVVGTGVDTYGAVVASVVGGARRSVTTASSVSFRAGGGYHNRDGFARADDVIDIGAEDDIRLNTQYRQYDGFAAIRWQGAKGRYLAATATGYSTERGVAPELHVEQPRFWKYPNQSRVLGILSAGTGLVATPFGFGSIAATGGYNRGTTEITAFTDAAYNEVTNREWGDERLYNGHLRLSHSLPMGGELRAAFTGARVHYGETLDDTPTTQYEQQLWSSGAEAQFPITNRFLVSGGVVNDASTTPESGGREPLGRSSRWGWRVGASMFAFGDRTRIHASVSERSRFPALRELYSGALNRFAPNPDLKPETLLGTEVGVTLVASQTAVRTLSFQVVGFHHDLDNAVVRTTLPAPDRRFLRINRDQVRTTGAELFGTWIPSASGISVSADLLVQDINVRDKTISNGDRLPEHQPEVRGGIELDVPLFFDSQGIAALRYVGAQHCLNPDSGAFQKLERETVGNVGVQRTWRLRTGPGILSSLRTMLALDNVTDSAIYDQCGLPQPGRTLRFGIQLR
ncbi:MAG: TonB-dependent receptor [Anaerolineae bacterium]|nr:TonB-dependent receptor [Gemmatimonadaceae bacterium]